MSTQPTSIILGQRIEQAHDEAPGTDLQQMVGKIAGILSHRRWLFVLPLMAGTLLSLTVSLFLPRRYLVSAIFERRDDVVITKLVTDNSPYSFGTLRQSLAISLMGYTALGEVVDQLELTRGYPRDPQGQLNAEGRAMKQALVSNLSRDLDVNILEKSNYLDMIEVRYKGSQPDLGVKLVSRLKDNYMIRTRLYISEILRKSQDFFSQEVTRRKERAARMEAELLEFAVSHPGVDPGDPDLLDSKLKSENQTLDDLARRKADAESNLEARESYLGAISPEALRTGHVAASRPAVLSSSLIANPNRLRLKQEVETVRTQIADAKSLKGMTDLHPTVEGLREKLEQLTAEFNRTPETLIAEPVHETVTGLPVLDPLEGERQRTARELTTLRALIPQLNKEIALHQEARAKLEQERPGLFERRKSFMIHRQELSGTKADLSVWEGHLDTISRVLVAEAEDRGIRFSTVEEARRPRTASTPTVPGVFLISIGLGFALGVASVFLREMFDRSFRHPTRVRASLGIPVLEAIGEICVNPPRGLFTARRLMPAIASLQVVALMGMSVLAYLSLEQPALFHRIVPAWVMMGTS